MLLRVSLFVGCSNHSNDLENAKNSQGNFVSLMNLENLGNKVVLTKTDSCQHKKIISKRCLENLNL